MTGRSISQIMAVLAAATLTATLAGVVIGADVERAAKKKARCDGVVATKVGTAKADVIRGTAGRDIIAGLGGNDIIIGRGGNDIICGGAGNDRLVGGAGHDKLLGQTGRDRLFGGGGVDRLFGGLHNDVLAGQAGPDVLGGGAGRDRLDGGVGVDLCSQGTGHGPMMRCELPKAVFATPAPPPPAPAAKVLAIAWSDLNRDYVYGDGDVMIAKLVDTNGDEIPSKGDTIEMGAHPVTANPTSPAQYLAWRESRHVVASIVNQTSEYVVVTNEAGGFHTWTKTSGSYRDQYDEESATGSSEVDDWRGYDEEDRVDVEVGSPSRPSRTDSWTHKGLGDDLLVDVELYY